MKKWVLALLFSGGCYVAAAQFVAVMEIKDSDSITGLCNRKKVYVLLPMFKGQEEAVCPVTNTAIRERLNQEVEYLKTNPNYSDKGMVNIVVNCKGEVVKVRIDNKTKSEELDAQVLAVFNSLGGIWKAGKLNGENVDSSRLWSFEIKKGKILLE